jgi:hypothetical protein
MAFTTITMTRITPENPVAPRLVLGMGVGYKTPRYELIGAGDKTPRYKLISEGIIEK